MVRNLVAIRRLSMAATLLLAGCTAPLPPPVVDPPPAAPTGLVVEPGDGEVRLRWQASSDSDLERYLVGWSPAAGESGKAVPALTTETFAYDLENGTAYRFDVRAVDLAGQSSSPSEPMWATPMAETPPEGTPVRPSELRAVAGDGLVTLSWEVADTAQLTAASVLWGVAPDALESRRTLAPDVTTSAVAGLDNGTTYYFAVEVETATGLTARSDVEASTPQAPALAPRIDRVAIDGYGLSDQVRQGADTVTLVVQGAQLADLTAAALGELEAGVTLISDAEVRIEGSILHGTELGFLALTLVGPGGVTVWPEAIEITPITVMKEPIFQPSDDTGFGTPNRPFETLGRALEVAGNGDTILLGVGTYRDGESWPSEDGGFPPRATPNVPSGVTIVGQARDGVILEGPGRDATLAALVFAGDGAVRDLTIRDFRRGLLFTTTDGSDLELEHVRVLSGYTGLFAYDAASVLIRDSEFFGHYDPAVDDGVGIYIIGQAEVEVVDTVASANGDGLALEGLARATIEGSTLSGNSQIGLFLRGALATLSESVVADNLLDGIHLDISNYADGLEGFTMRDTTVRDNRRYGLYLRGSSPYVDLGIPDDPGGNAIGGNVDFQLFDDRAAGSALAVPLIGTTLGGVILTGGLFTAPPGGTEFVSGGTKFWRIERQGNSLLFDP